MMEMKVTKINHYHLRALAVLVALALAVSLLAGETGPAKAAFPGANGKIVFASNRDGNVELYSRNPEGTNQTNLTRSAAVDHSPAFSPDGKKIAYTSIRSGNYEVHTMNALDGSGQKNRTNSGAADVDSDWGIVTP
jgi:hypothetical protein